jgi:hypothetical protein
MSGLDRVYQEERYEGQCDGQKVEVIVVTTDGRTGLRITYGQHVISWMTPELLEMIYTNLF